MTKQDDAYHSGPGASAIGRTRAFTYSVHVATGILVNILCCVVFRLAAARLTAISPLSTFVLTYAPVIQGALIVLPILLGAASVRKAGGRKTLLAVGMYVGTAIQVTGFVLWYIHWVNVHAS